MAGAKDTPPPRKKIVRKRGHGGHHGGAWKVAYADFVTAMMALFLVLWLIGQNSKVKESVAQYFRNPTEYFKKVGISKTNRVTTVLPGGDGLMKGQPPANNAPRQGNQGEGELSGLGNALRQYFDEHPELKDLKDQIQIDMVSDGLRIQIIDQTDGMMFDLGSAKLKPHTVKILRKIAEEVAKMTNQVVIEGYTDSHQYDNPKHYSNWELSTDRANHTRRVLEENGLRVDQIVRVTGYSDKQLFNPKNPYDPTNRRISITVLYHQETVATQTPASEAPAAKEPAPGSEPKAQPAGAEKAQPRAQSPRASLATPGQQGR